jgi:hypothetical protein
LAPASAQLEPFNPATTYGLAFTAVAGTHSNWLWVLVAAVKMMLLPG